MEHTPTPWEVDNHGIIFHGKTQIGTVATQPMYKEAPEGTTEANARFIVKACNNYEKLVEALEAIKRHITSGANLYVVEKTVIRLCDEVLS